MFSAGNFQRNGYGDREWSGGERGKAERKHGRGRNRETREGASGGAIGGEGVARDERGRSKKKKKNIERDLSKAFLGLLTLYEFSPNPTRSSEKCPTPLSIPNHFPSLLKSPKLSPPTAQTTR